MVTEKYLSSCSSLRAYVSVYSCAGRGKGGVRRSHLLEQGNSLCQTKAATEDIACSRDRFIPPDPCVDSLRLQL